MSSGGVPSDFLPPLSVSGPLYDLLPSLTAHAGDVLRSGSEGGGQDDAIGSATVTTGLPPTELAAHFTAQLTAAGWRVNERRSREGSAVVRLERRESGNVYGARLSVTRPAGQT